MKIKVFRPLLSLGVIAIALAVFSYLLVPAWRGSSIGVIILLGALLAGLAAIAADIRNIVSELRAYRSGDGENGSPPPQT